MDVYEIWTHLNKCRHAAVGLTNERDCGGVLGILMRFNYWDSRRGRYVEEAIPIEDLSIDFLLISVKGSPSRVRVVGRWTN